MRNIRLLIEYEGTDYAGWQFQPSLPTVQGELASAVKELTGEDVEVRGASRTDAGVHASGQVACFNTTSLIPAFNIRQGLNSYLPKDIIVKDASDAPAEFDPRRDSRGKVYRYDILNRSYPSALRRNFVWHVFKPLDVGLMREGAAHIIGEKDFSSFRAADSDAIHSMREVTSVEIEEKGDGFIEVEVRGTAFLRHMVRIMVGTLVAVGKGKVLPDKVAAIIEAKERAAAGMTAPPQGLFLIKVEY
ncbi:MAG: tRNA pseudouridine(38-40) synthase TruA [Deltaproteobacteria bacterium]|nr:tRNA pseudouridine(38-40) synthase TruA [Deltaproteobacteria bacterium]